jgi:DNA segregation ATPase FtsK/SpoIIIE-like protein
MFTVVENLREAAEALNFLVSEVEYRIEQEITWPLLVLMIDDVDQLVEMGGRPIIEPLTYLLEEGVNAGMRIVLGASNPDSNAIRPLLKNSVPVRLVGQLSDATTARAITGIPDSQAEYLRGQGDFIAVSNGMILPFQAAFITDYDLHLILDKLHRQSQPVMVAQPLTVRPTLAPPDEEPEQAQFFEFNSQDRRASLGSSSRNGSPPRVIEAINRPNVRRWDEKEGRIEEAVWEEIDEDEDAWEDEAAEDKEEETIIDIWAGFEDKSEGEDDWEEDDDETDTAIEVWSTPKKPDNGRVVRKPDSQEIEFDWD